MSSNRVGSQRNMSSIQAELENVEQQLGTTEQVQASGRAVFQSIRSSLNSIRTRLEDHLTTQNHPTTDTNSPSNASTSIAAARPRSNSIGSRLLERLRNAELSHSTRIPLPILQTELSRRETEESASEQTNTASRKRPNAESPRRSSIAMASRLRSEAQEGPVADMDLHGTTTARRASRCDLVNLEEGDASIKAENVRDEEVSESDASLSDSSERPTLLLTKRSRSKLNLASEVVLFPPLEEMTPISETKPMTDAESKAAPPVLTPAVYSWGTGVNSLHDDDKDRNSCTQIASSARIGRTEIVSCSIGVTHSACVSASGKLLVVGCNSSGEVDPEKRTQEIISKPTMLESLSFQATIVQVSCGFNHTAALRSNGAILTWGANEFGQLGHGTDERTITFCKPSIFVLGAGRWATAVACGDGFTLALTSRMELLACGVEDIIGTDDIAASGSRRLPRPIPALQDLPLVAVAAGRRHAVAITSHGSCFAWGSNAHGQCGQEYPKQLDIPVLVQPSCEGLSESVQNQLLSPPLSSWLYTEENSHVALVDSIAIVQVACGGDHSLLVTRAGKVFACGRWGEGKSKVIPRLIGHEDELKSFEVAAAGEQHSLLLDDYGDVWTLSDESQNATQVLRGKGIKYISAGGFQSVCIAVCSNRKNAPQRAISDPFSRYDELKLPDSVEEMIQTLDDNMLKVGGNISTDAAVADICSRVEELLRTPNVLNALFIDPTELEEFYARLLSIKHDGFRRSVAIAIEKGMRNGLESLKADDTRFKWPEQVRFLLLYIQCPLFKDWKSEPHIFDRRSDLILSLCEIILGIPYEGYKALMAWATSIYSRDLFVRLLLEPLLIQLEKGLSVEAGAERRPIPAIVSVLRWLYNASERAGGVANHEDFYSEAISTMRIDQLFVDLQNYKCANKQEKATSFFFCDNAFLISPMTKRNLLQIENETNMLKTAARGLTYNAQEQTYEFNPFYVLDIDREHLLTQTLQKIGKAEPADLRKKLKVVFKGEDGVDAGGVTREYFQLLEAQLFDVGTGMWSTRFGGEDGRITWFNSDCSWNDEGFFLSGVMVGMALYNSVLLGVNFPQAVYRKLLKLPLGLEDMIDEELKSGLQQLLDYDGDDVEDIFCLTFDVNWVDLGVDKRKELKPNGSKISVTADNKEEYVMLYVQWLLDDSIYPQYASFEDGFMRVMKDSSLDLLIPEELELLTLGSPVLDFDALEETTVYEGGYDKESAVVVNLWRFVKASCKETQLDFLKFVTGSAKAPIGGLGQMNFKVQRAGPDSDHLPTSHTCFSTLLLPDYGNNFEKLADLVGRSIRECEGFGLQ